MSETRMGKYKDSDYQRKYQAEYRKKNKEKTSQYNAIYYQNYIKKPIDISTEKESINA